MPECITTDAPSASGFCSSGVAKVLSTATFAPAARAASHSAGRSATCSSGLVGDSMISQSAPGSSATTASVSLMSTRVSENRPAVDNWPASDSIEP